MTPLETVVAALEARGHHVKNGSARCPAHDDNSPSLSVGEKADGKAVVKCHTGCTSQAIIDALNLTFTDLFPPREDASTVVARYPYTDENGVVLYEIERRIRHGEKTFWARRPDGTGGWIYKKAMEGVRRVVYNLPAVLNAIATGTTIYVVEGEKDVHSLKAVGVVATCNPFGANKFTAELAAQLYGATEIVIVADKDEPGSEHARHVADLLQGNVTNVTIWEAAEGKDASDHLAAGFTLNDLVPADVGQYHEHTTDPTPSQAWINWDELWNDEIPDEEWAIEPLIPKGRGVSLYAPAKEGKSTILLAAAAAAATGRSVFGLQPQPPIRAVYGDYEMTRADLKARLTELGYGPDIDLTNLYYYIIPPWAPLDTVEGGAMITAAALSHQAEVVFVDTIGRAVAGDEDKSDTMRAFYRCTGQTLKREGIAWLRADHSGKDPAKGARGTSAKNDDVDIQWSLKRGDDSITIKRTHTRIDWAPATITLQKREDDNGVITYEMTGAKGYLAGTKELAHALDELGVDPHATRAKARAALVAAKHQARNDVLSDAIRFRKEKCGTGPGTNFWPFGDRPNTRPGTDTQTTTSTHGDQPGDQRGQTPAADGTESHPIGGTGTSRAPNPIIEEMF